MSVKSRQRSITSLNSGFTLVELVVTILLLGILAAVALPKFFNVSDYQERATYDEVAGAVRYAQKLAVASGCDVRVNITANSYALQQHSTDCTTGAFATIINHPITSDVISGVNLVSAPNSFIFDAMGRSSNAATITVGTKVFNVIAATGYVNAQP